MVNKLRMKDACARTGLTERAVRLYVEKGLLHPLQEEQNDRVLTFFSEEDIARLEDIAVLRKAGFSIDSIVTMTKYPQTIGDIVKEQLEKTAKEAEDSRAVTELLQNAARENCRTVHELCTALNREPMRSIPVPHTDSEPDFSKFEDATEQERLDGYVDHVITQRKMDKREEKLRKLKKIGKVLGCIAAVLGVIWAVNFIPKRIDRTMTCYQYNGTTGEVACTVEVTVKGKFYTPLLMHAFFKGDISIVQQGEVVDEQAFSPLGAAYGQQLEHMEFIDSGYVAPYAGWLFYDDGQMGLPFNFGYIQLYEKDFSDFEIWVFEPIDPDYEGGRSASPERTIIDTDLINRFYTDNPKP